MPASPREDPRPGFPTTDAPAPFSRADRGDPLTAAEIAAATDDYLVLRHSIRYFENLEERVHGWPEWAPAGYWCGTWWSGVSVVKQDGKVTFRHGAAGADNNGLRTGPMLDGACFAWALKDRDAASLRVTPALAPAWDLFAPGTPDGTYPFEIDANGGWFRHLGAMLGACASPYANPTSKPLFHCNRICQAPQIPTGRAARRLPSRRPRFDVAGSGVVQSTAACSGESR